MSEIEPFLSDHIEQVAMPTGSCVFELGIGNKRWSRHRNWVNFPTKLNSLPSDILFTNVIFEGTADLTVTKIMKTGFWYMVTSTNSGNNWGVTSVSFDWEAIK